MKKKIQGTITLDFIAEFDESKIKEDGYEYIRHVEKYADILTQTTVENIFEELGVKVEAGDVKYRHMDAISFKFLSSESQITGENHE